MKSSVLIAHQEPNIAALLETALTLSGFHVVGVCHDAVRALKLAKQLRPHFLSMPDDLPGMSRVELIAAMERVHLNVAIVASNDVLAGITATTTPRWQQLPGVSARLRTNPL